MRYLTGAGLIILAGVVWSVQGVLIRQLHESGSWAVLFWRSMGMVPVLVLWIGPTRVLPALRQVGAAGAVGGLGLAVEQLGGRLAASEREQGEQEEPVAWMSGDHVRPRLGRRIRRLRTLRNRT